MEFGTSLQGHISWWTKNAEVHMPCIPCLAEVDAEAALENAQVPPPYDLKIWMPSHIYKHGHIGARNLQDQMLRDSLDAYAKQQAALHLQWSAQFKEMWADILIWIPQGTVPDNLHSEDAIARPPE
ncbi:hypothetical protein FISHEDRAFT_75020 [Fistulina hepatica ATCC 64428]|uniref:Uncharacterized protein n=1 Tax=Fistulina hepatica ATCC 64428 TaxID=1128425 RepID=A0A0D7AAY6_9AGAR|nr:hypothetical protein FISHEDRAFT_75020 [Fistulina hepatica ATCC 64428]